MKDTSHALAAPGGEGVNGLGLNPHPNSKLLLRLFLLPSFKAALITSNSCLNKSNKQTQIQNQQMHQTSGRWFLGLALSLLTAILWGVLPIFLSITQQGLDIYTLTWFRYLVCFCFVGFYLKWRGNLPSFSQLSSNSLKLLAIAAIFLGIFNILYTQGLAITTAANAEVLLQLSPLLIGLGGLVIFKERYTLVQWIGIIILIIGLILFFNEELSHLISLQTKYLFGSFLIVLSAVFLSVYILIQKQLLQNLSSTHLILIINGVNTLLLTIIANPETIFTLDSLQMSMLIASGLNTLISYSAFAEALEHLEASRVGAVLALAPLITLFSAWLLSEISPNLIPAEQFTLLVIIGAILVVCGCAAITINVDEFYEPTPQINPQTAFLIMSKNLNSEGYLDSSVLNLYKFFTYKDNLIKR
ncbi:MAG: DMT family transporter [Cyanobacteria bacterium J06635_10]